MDFSFCRSTTFKSASIDSYSPYVYCRMATTLRGKDYLFKYNFRWRIKGYKADAMFSVISYAFYLSACEASFSTETVMQMCHGKRRCTLNASSSTFGNPCSPQSHLYLRVVYTCGNSLMTLLINGGWNSLSLNWWWSFQFHGRSWKIIIKESWKRTKCRIIKLHSTTRTWWARTRSNRKTTPNRFLQPRPFLLDTSQPKMTQAIMTMRITTERLTDLSATSKPSVADLSVICLH